jgi:PilZ domain
MASIPAFSALRAREPRISVVVPARMRVGARWSDACILNISSRGLLIRSPEGADRGSYVELRRGDQVIIGRVVWRSGARLGLRAQDRVPVEAIVTSKLALSRCTPTQHAAPVERRRVRREHEQSRLRARATEFASIVLVGVTLSAAVFSMVTGAVASPLSRVRTALAGQAAVPADSR